LPGILTSRTLLTTSVYDQRRAGAGQESYLFVESKCSSSISTIMMLLYVSTTLFIIIKLFIARFLVAERDIRPGELLAVEHSHVALLGDSL
jgi:hypothetical protein